MHLSGPPPHHQWSKQLTLRVLQVLVIGGAPLWARPRQPLPCDWLLDVSPLPLLVAGPAAAEDRVSRCGHLPERLTRRPLPDRRRGRRPLPVGGENSFLARLPVAPPPPLTPNAVIGPGVDRCAAGRAQPSLPGRHLPALLHRRQPFCVRREGQSGAGLEPGQVATPTAWPHPPPPLHRLHRLHLSCVCLAAWCSWI